jgi:hypothetical protein
MENSDAARVDTDYTFYRMVVNTGLVIKKTTYNEEKEDKNYS